MLRHTAKRAWDGLQRLRTSAKALCAGVTLLLLAFLVRLALGNGDHQRRELELVEWQAQLNNWQVGLDSQEAELQAWEADLAERDATLQRDASEVVRLHVAYIELLRREQSAAQPPANLPN
jgi:hypothetical protein